MILSDTYDISEAKSFFEQYYSHIYYIFHDHFTTVEADLKQRGEVVLTYKSALYMYHAYWYDSTTFKHCKKLLYQQTTQVLTLSFDNF